MTIENSSFFAFGDSIVSIFTPINAKELERDLGVNSNLIMRAVYGCNKGKEEFIFKKQI